MLKFKIERAPFLTELAIVLGAVQEKSTIPILGNILIAAKESSLEGGKAISLTGTNLDRAVFVTVPAEIQGTGGVTVPAKKLFDIAKVAKADFLDIAELDNGWISIQGDTSKYKLVGLPANEYPEIPRPDPIEAAWVSFPADAFLDGIDRAAFTSSDKGGSHAAYGALVDIDESKFRVVSTDGHRMVYFESARPEGETKFRAVIPRKALDELKAVTQGEGATLELSLGDNHIFFRIGERLFVSKVASNEFPAYDKIIAFADGRDSVVKVKLEEFIGALRRVSPLVAKNGAVKMTLESDLIKFESNSVEYGEASEQCAATFENPREFSCGINIRYVSEFVSACKLSELAILVDKDDNPLVIRSAGDEAFRYDYILMPMRL